MTTRKFWMTAIGAMILLAGSLSAWALAEPPAAQTVKAEVKIVGDGRTVTIVTPDNAQAQSSTFTFVSSEMSFDTKVVKGVPFSADAVSEFTQTLSNGQRIYRKTASSVYRDSEGRTRREQTINAIGPFTSSGTAHQTISINDPVAGVIYILNPEDRTATKVQFSISAQGASAVIYGGGSGLGAVAGGVSEVRAASITIGGGEVITTTTKAESTSSRTESLGVQNIEGVQVEGTRTVETIPTGAIGNDSPIEIISERWFSPELGMVVRTRHNDPRSGEYVYQFTNIRRGEPSPTLFQVPADYAIKEGPTSKIQTIKKDPVE